MKDNIYLGKKTKSARSMSLASLIEPNIALTSLMHGISINGGKLSFYQHFLFSDNLRTYNLIWLSSSSLQLLSAEPRVFRMILKPNSKKKHRRCMYMCELCVCVWWGGVCVRVGVLFGR